MLKHKILGAAAAFLLVTGGVASSDAQEAYPQSLSDQFVSWCTSAQDQSPTVCSCAVDKAALEIPASALASFLSAVEGGAVASVTQGVGATAVQIIASCSLGGSSTGSGVLNSLGGFGK